VTGDNRNCPVITLFATFVHNGITPEFAVFTSVNITKTSV